MPRPAALLSFVLLAFVCGEFRPPVNTATGRTPAPDEPKAEKPAPKAGELRAGVAKVEITNKKVLPLNDPLYVKALVLKSDTKTVGQIQRTV